MNKFFKILTATLLFCAITQQAQAAIYDLYIRTLWNLDDSLFYPGVDSKTISMGQIRERVAHDLGIPKERISLFIGKNAIQDYNALWEDVIGQYGLDTISAMTI